MSGSSFAVNWLRDDAKARRFLETRFRSETQRALAVAEAGKRGLSRELHSAIQSFNVGWPGATARNRQLDRLSQPGAVAVVTGQQLGLFLGPLFTLYKAAAAIVVARALEEETKRPCVPVFWLQCEDHDLPEIDHTFLPGENSVVTLRLTHPDRETTRAPLAARKVGSSVNEVFTALRQEVGEEPHAEEMLSLLERTYRPDATLLQAFTELLATAFEDEGLVFVNPRQPEISALSREVHARALREATKISSLLETRSRELREAGFAEQVHVRAGSPLSFFSPDDVEQGPRHRLEPATGGFDLVGDADKRVLSLSDFESALKKEPLRFSTSALLRPLLQDSLLPTAAYVGGPGEIAYFAQLGPLYAHWGIPMPLIIPRARFRILDARTRSLLKRLGVSADQVCGDRDALLAGLSTGPDHETPSAWKARIEAMWRKELDSLSKTLPALDPSLTRSVRRTEGTIQTALSRIFGKYERALARKDHVLVDRVDRARRALYPNNAPQERIYGMTSYASRFGLRALVQNILSGTKPFSGELEDLCP